MKNKFLNLIIAFMLLVTSLPALASDIQKATVINLETGHRKVVTVGNPNAFAGGYSLEVATGYELIPDDALGYSVATGYKTTLASSMTSTQSTVSASSITTTDGTTLTMGVLGSKVFFTIEPGGSKQEIVMCTGISGTSWTGCTRGLSFVGTSTASVTANRKTHSAGSVIIMSNVHYAYDELVDKDSNETIAGDKTFSGNLTFNELPILDTYEAPVDDKDFITKKYADDLTNQGAATPTETVAGIGQIATQEEQSGNIFGSTAPTFLSTKYSNSSNLNLTNIANNIDVSDEGDSAVYGTIYQAQSFTPSASVTLKEVRLKMHTTGTPAGDISVVIYNADSGDLPTGSSLGTSNISAFTSTGITKQFYFTDGVSLTSGNKYALVVKSPSSVNSSNSYKIEISDNAFSGGAYSVSTDSGSSYEIEEGSELSDLIFSAYYEDGTAAHNVVVSEDDGKLNQGWLDLTEDFTFASTTMTGTTTFQVAPESFTDAITDNGLTRKSYVDSEVKVYYQTVCAGVSYYGNSSNGYYFHSGYNGSNNGLAPDETTAGQGNGIAVATTTVDRLYTDVDANSLDSTLTISFGGGTGSSLSVSYSATQTGDKNDTLTDFKTLVPGDKWYFVLSEGAGSGFATGINACVRFKMEMD